MKKGLISLFAIILIFGLSNQAYMGVAYADAKPGDVIVTLGEDLTPEQKDSVLSDMHVNENDVQVVHVSNKEEHKYLDKYIPKAQIGTKSISSSKITLGEKGTGLVVESHNIDYITNDMYRNALSTAGVTDANVYVTAPFTVSGTGALTGIIKAYEISSGVAINEKQKQIANQEMASTAKLGKDIGQQKAVDFMNKIKEEISKEKPQNEEELRALIQKVAADMGIQLTEDQLNQLVDLFNKIKDLNIDWNKVNQTLQAAKQNWDQFANSDEGKNIIDKFIAFLKAIVQGIASLFSQS